MQTIGSLQPLEISYTSIDFVTSLQGCTQYWPYGGHTYLLECTKGVLFRCRGNKTYIAIVYQFYSFGRYTR